MRRVIIEQHSTARHIAIHFCALFMSTSLAIAHFRALLIRYSSSLRSEQRRRAGDAFRRRTGDEKLMRWIGVIVQKTRQLVHVLSKLVTDPIVLEFLMLHYHSAPGVTLGTCSSHVEAFQFLVSRYRDAIAAAHAL